MQFIMIKIQEKIEGNITIKFAILSSSIKKNFFKHSSYFFSKRGTFEDLINQINYLLKTYYA